MMTYTVPRSLHCSLEIKISGRKFLLELGAKVWERTDLPLSASTEGDRDLPPNHTCNKEAAQTGSSCYVAEQRR
jgi:hypothetical protein